MSHSRDPGIDLMSGKLTSLSWLGALGDFDLQLLRVDQVITGYAKTTGGNLLDRAIPGITVGLGVVTIRVFPSLSSIALAAQAIHGNGQRFVGFLADRSIGHRSGLEAPDDRFHRLYFIDRDRRAI